MCQIDIHVIEDTKKKNRYPELEVVFSDLSGGGVGYINNREETVRIMHYNASNPTRKPTDINIK